MGLILRAKEYLANKAISAAKGVADAISTVSSLSPKQVKEIEDRKEKYLSFLPNEDNAAAIAERILAKVGVETEQAYILQLSELYSPVGNVLDSFDEENRIRYFDITRWTKDKDELAISNLTSVYNAMSKETDCNIALIYHRTAEKCYVSFGIVNNDPRKSDPSVADSYSQRVAKSFKGNFPGAVIEKSDPDSSDFGIGMPEFLENLVSGSSRTKSVAAVSNVASERSKDFISQGIEKLLDGYVPKNKNDEYTLVLIANPVTDFKDRKQYLCNLQTELSPYATRQRTKGYQESSVKSSAANVGAYAGGYAGAAAGKNEGISHTDSNTNSVNINPTDALKKDILKDGLGEKIKDFTSSASKSKSDTTSSGFNLGAHAGVNFGLNFARSSNESMQVGKNESVTETRTNYGIKHAIDFLDSRIKRLEEGNGLWEFAAYVVSEDPSTAKDVANQYLSLTQGEKSYFTENAINFWDGYENSDAAKVILAYIQRLQHPLFGLKATLDDSWLCYPSLTTPSIAVTGNELAKAMNFPRKSIPGLQVTENAAFGRDAGTPKSSGDLDIGCLYHMREAFNEQRFFLSKDDLTKHTFITGSTGSGKTNTVYNLLEKAAEKGISFLVVEPAKGEYKDEIGTKNGVVTFGTNPRSCKRMLKLNPFRFSETIFITEHIDRLKELFNACWPMQAAMPQILKQSIEKAYEDCGWNLKTGENKISPTDPIFPTFADVIEKIEDIINSSQYSAENKGDYKGALITRLQDLTTGSNALIFGSNDLCDDELFDQNVIVDISRIGSQETKSLIMGILVLKLNEYRKDQKDRGEIKNNNPLRHLTVLEEAHNLLKRTSTEQHIDSSNLIGKSVEMITNSIAEMRTFGEGFVIVDQAPGLLDMAVIRNTNTKIIHKLPDYSDRDLVCKACGMKEEHIEEIAKLETGVASIYQGNMEIAELCKIDRYEGKEDSFSKIPQIKHDAAEEHDEEEIEKEILDFIIKNEFSKETEKVDLKSFENRVLNSGLRGSIKSDFLHYIKAKDDKKILGRLSYDLLKAGKAFDESKNCGEIKALTLSVLNKLSPSLNGYIEEYENNVLNLFRLMLQEQIQRDITFNDIYLSFTEFYKNGGRIF